MSKVDSLSWKHCTLVKVFKSTNVSASIQRPSSVNNKLTSSKNELVNLLFTDDGL